VRKSLYAAAAVSFVAIFLLDVPFPFIVIGAGLIGWLAGGRNPRWFPLGDQHVGDGAAQSGALLSEGDEAPVPGEMIGVRLVGDEHLLGAHSVDHFAALDAPEIRTRFDAEGAGQLGVKAPRALVLHHRVAEGAAAVTHGHRVDQESVTANALRGLQPHHF